MNTIARCMLPSLALALLAHGQISPAQGPPKPPAGAVIRELGVKSVITESLKIKLEEKLTQINTEQASRTDYRARVSLKKISVWGPGIVQTDFTDRPNHRYVRVPYIIEFKIDRIQHAVGTVNCNVNGPPFGCPAIHGQIMWSTYPWSRTLYMSMEAQSFCSGWQTGSGHIQIVGRPQPPYLDSDTSITEDIVNAFLLGQLVPYVNSKIRNAITNPGGFSQTLTGSRCNTLSAFGGDLNDLNDDAIQWSEPPLNPFPNLTAGVTVRATRVKRLQARNRYNGIVYEPVESPALDFYAGFGHQYLQLPPMTEGQEVALAAPAMSVIPRLTGSMSLVVIASTINGLNTDSNFGVFSAATSYGAGTRTLVIYKKYFLPPSPVNPKPSIIPVAAYEVMFEVGNPNTGTLGSF